MKTYFKIRVVVIIFLSSLFFSITTSCLDIKKISSPIRQAPESKCPSNSPTVNSPTIEEIVTNLCSDKFEGRRTFSNGNKKAGEYIASIFKDIGLDPVFGDSYFQEYIQDVGYINGTNPNGDKRVNNIVGAINGKNNEKAVIISAHFDSLGIKNGSIHRGALDNASGVAALIEIAKSLKKMSAEKPFENNIIFCAFNGEEQLYFGSAAFVKQSKSKSWYKGMYNINIDCIGAKNGGNLIYPNDSKYSKKLYDAITSSMNKNNINLKETKEVVGSDHRSFEKSQKNNICISQENLKQWANSPKDIPNILDYNKIEEIANAICNFIRSSDGIVY